MTIRKDRIRCANLIGLFRFRSLYRFYPHLDVCIFKMYEQGCCGLEAIKGAGSRRK